MAIPSLDYTRPYNDAFMKYNYEENRYVLTEEGALQSRLDMVTIWRSSENLADYLGLLSRTLYSVFLKNKDSKYHDKQLWLMAHSKHFRKSIYKMFQDVIWYNFTSGGFLTLYQSGINLNEMKTLELDIENAMSVIGNNMAHITGINERVPRYRPTKVNYFQTFDELKNEIETRGIYTNEQLEKWKVVEEIPNKTMVTFNYNRFYDKYFIEDYNYWNEVLNEKGSRW